MGTKCYRTTSSVGNRLIDFSRLTFTRCWTLNDNDEKKSGSSSVIPWRTHPTVTLYSVVRSIGGEPRSSWLWLRWLALFNGFLILLPTLFVVSLAGVLLAGVEYRVSLNVEIKKKRKKKNAFSLFLSLCFNLFCFINVLRRRWRHQLTPPVLI